MADAVVADVARFPLRQSLFPEALLQRRVAAGVGVGDRHAPRQAGVEPDPRGVTGRVHELVTVVHPQRRHPRKRDGGLAVVQRRRGQDAADGDVTVGGVDMEFVPSPALFVPLRVALRAGVAGLRQPVGHLRGGHPVRRPPLQPGPLPRPILPLLRASALSLRFLLRLRLRRRPLPPDDRRRVPRYVPDDRAGTVGAARRLVHPLGQPGLREPGEGPGERRFAGNLRHAGPADRTPQRRVVKQPVDRHHRGRHVPDRLRDEGPRQRPAVGGRVADAPVAVVDVPFHLHHVQDGDGFGVPHAQRADLPGEGGQKFPLKPLPGI